MDNVLQALDQTLDLEEYVQTGKWKRIPRSVHPSGRYAGWPFSDDEVLKNGKRLLVKHPAGREYAAGQMSRIRIADLPFGFE